MKLTNNNIGKKTLHGAVIMFQCQFCGRSFTIERDYEAHTLFKHDIQRYMQYGISPQL